MRCRQTGRAQVEEQRLAAMQQEDHQQTIRRLEDQVGHERQLVTALQKQNTRLRDQLHNVTGHTDVSLGSIIANNEAATKRQETIRSRDLATERLEWESERAATYAAVQSLQHVGSHSLL